MEHDVSQDIQRSLGRIEGTQLQMLDAQKSIFRILENLTQEFSDHKSEDRQNFQIISSRMGALEKSVTATSESDIKITEERELRLTKMRGQLETINGYIENIKGAWWFILVIIAVIAGFGALVLWGIQVWQARNSIS